MGEEVETETRGEDEEEDPIPLILLAALAWIGVTGASLYVSTKEKGIPESSSRIGYEGFEVLMEGVRDSDVDKAVAEQSTKMEAKWQETIKPGSPLTPAEAAKRAGPFIKTINDGYAIMAAAMVGFEIMSWGQIDHCLTEFAKVPGIRAATEAVVEMMKTQYNASMGIGLKHQLLDQHQPVVLPEQVVTDLYNMGLLTEAPYIGYMKYHGYTDYRSRLIAKTRVNILSADVILELLRRRELTETGAVNWLRLQRIPESMAETYTKLRWKIPGVRDLASAAAKGILPDEGYKTAMAESGLSSGWANILRDAAYQWLGLETLLTLLRREEISEADFHSALRFSGLSNVWADHAVHLKAVIPPIQDLRLMAVREAFPVAPGKPQYAEMEKWAIKMGLDPYWTERYLYMGFIRMDVSDAMKHFLWYHNEPEAYEEWLRIADIHPDDRPRVREVSYRLPSLRELGYGYDMGVYTRDMIRDIRRRGGLNTDDAEKAADSMVAYRVSAEMEAVRREWLHLVSMGRKTLPEFKAKLTEMKTSPAAIPLWLERAELETERRKKPAPEYEYRIITSSEALWAFRNDLRDEKWVRAQLKELDWTEDRIGLAVERVQKEKVVPEKPPPEVKYRDLTLTQIRDLYRFRKLPKAELPAAFEGLGYRPEDAAELAQILVATEAERLIPDYTSERNKLRDNAKEDFVLGFILEDVLRADLEVLGYDSEEVEYYVADAKADRQRRHKKDLLDVSEDYYMKDLMTDEDVKAVGGEVIKDPDALELWLEKVFIRKYKKPKVAEAD